MAINYQLILDSICEEVKPLLSKGKVANYIPELARVEPRQFGIAVYCVDGRSFAAGDAEVRFSAQSVTKLFGLALAFSREGDAIWKRVGREPSGNPFNSLYQLELAKGIPRNPFINAGALVIHDILAQRFVQADMAILQFMRTVAREASLDFDPAVWHSEEQTAHRNYAIAHLMKDFGNLRGRVEDIVRGYCRQCSIAINCVELARAGAFLANHGTVPWDFTRIMDPSSSKRLNAAMLTCGTYDAAGDFAYRVGLPAKSGVGGGIIALVPGELAIAVWSPGLDENGNSLAGTMALERFTTLTARSIF